MHFSCPVPCFLFSIMSVLNMLMSSMGVPASARTVLVVAVPASMMFAMPVHVMPMVVEFLHMMEPMPMMQHDSGWAIAHTKFKIASAGLSFDLEGVNGHDAQNYC